MLHLWNDERVKIRIQENGESHDWMMFKSHTGDNYWGDNELIFQAYDGSSANPVLVLKEDERVGIASTNLSHF